MNVLLVDDSSIMRRIVRKWMATLGAECFEKANGQEALAFIQEQDPDFLSLVILDTNMPVMTGPDLLQALKECDSTRAIPVIMLSAESEKTSVERSLAMGAAGYVTKPFTGDTLLAAVRDTLSLPA